jgi:CRISPR-associated protein Cas2
VIHIVFIVVAYDIVEDAKRNRLAKVLTNFGVRVQKSVFECEIDDRQYLRMKAAIEKEIDPEWDSVRYYFLCRKCRENIQVSGLGSVLDDEEVIIV